MSTPRRHHYLPQFYLKGFSGNGTAVLQIDKKEGRAFPVAITNAAAMRDYHAIDTGVGDPNELEKRLSQIEGLHAQTIARLIEKPHSAPVTSQDVADLVALLRVRVPAFKAGVDRHLQLDVRSVGMMMERRGMLPPPPAGFEDVLRMDRLTIEIANWKLLEIMFVAAAGSLPALLGMKRSILRSPPGMHFLTSDQPVAVFNPTATATDTYGTGLVHSETQVSLPLSSSTMLKCGWGIDGPVDREATPDEVEEFNRRTVVMADSLVFGPETAFESAGFVARYAHCSAGMVEDLVIAEDASAVIVRFRPVLRHDCYRQDGPGSDQPTAAE